MSSISRVLDWIERGQRCLTVVFFFATLVVVGFQVFNRLVLRWPVLWTVDVSVFCFVWLALLSASCAVRSGGHFRVCALIDRPVFAGMPRRLFEALALAAVCVLSFVLMKLGMAFAWAGLHEQSPGLAMPMIWAYLSVPLCSATALLFALERLWLLWRDGDPAGGRPACDVKLAQASRAEGR